MCRAFPKWGLMFWTRKSKLAGDNFFSKVIFLNSIKKTTHNFKKYGPHMFLPPIDFDPNVPVLKYIPLRWVPNSLYSEKNSQVYSLGKWNIPNYYATTVIFVFLFSRNPVDCNGINNKFQDCNIYTVWYNI